MDVPGSAFFPKTVIAFGGPMRSGKTTASKHLIEAHGFINHPIAIGVKDMCRVLGLTNEHLYGNLKEQPTDLLCGKSPRHALQTLGSEWGRTHISPTVWVEYWARTVPPNIDTIVIDDLRTVEGAKWMQARGVTLVNISRPGLDTSGSEHQHETEKQFDRIPYDQTVVNDGSLDDLKQKLDDLVKTLQQNP